MFSGLKKAMFGPDRSGNAAEDPASPATPGEEPVGEAQAPEDNGVWENHGEAAPEEGLDTAEVKAAASDHDASSDMSKVELGKVMEMMELIGQQDNTDVQLKRDLLRHLRARKGDVPAAVEMYQAAMKWRQENKIDEMFDETDPNEAVFQCICGHRHHGWDKEGHPVYFERTGHVRMDHLTKHVTEDQIVMRHVRQMEYIIRRGRVSSKKVNRFVEKGVLICDLKDLPYGPHMAGQRVFRRTTRIDQDYYPERLHKIIFINAPFSFRGIWTIVKPWLNPVTQAKVEIVGGRYQDRLKELIPVEHIPKEYGGECECHYPNGDGCVPHVRPYPPESADSVPEEWPPLELASPVQLTAVSPTTQNEASGDANQPEEPKAE